MCRPLVALIAAAVLAGAPPARAEVPAPACPGVTATADRFANAGPAGLFWLENMGFDGRGGMWVSELTQNKLVRYDAAGMPGVALDVSAPGASLLGPDGRMYAMFGDGFSGEAGVVRFDPAAAQPVAEPYAAALKMANGAAFDAAGNLYVADTIDNLVAKVAPDGTVAPRFVENVPGADGIAIIGGDLYVTEFSDPDSTILRVPLADPARAEPLVALSPGGAEAKFLDDLAVGPDGRLYVASNRGELIRVDPDGSDPCIVAGGLPMVDSVRFAAAFPPFGDEDAFLTSQNGDLLHVRITGPATAAPPARRPRIRLRVRPRRVRARRRVRLRVRVTSPAPCRAGVRVGGARTGARGRARLRVRFAHRGRHVIVARKRGCRPGRARVRVS